MRNNYDKGTEAHDACESFQQAIRELEDAQNGVEGTAEEVCDSIAWLEEELEDTKTELSEALSSKEETIHQAKILFWKQLISCAEAEIKKLEEQHDKNPDSGDRVSSDALAESDLKPGGTD